MITSTFSIDLGLPHVEVLNIRTDQGVITTLKFVVQKRKDVVISVGLYYPIFMGMTVKLRFNTFLF
jgi:hypothetical protein